MCANTNQLGKGWCSCLETTFLFCQIIFAVKFKSIFTFLQKEIKLEEEQCLDDELLEMALED